jgi:hypothetical protein
MIGPHFRDKEMGIHGQPAANPQPTHNYYWSAFWTQKYGNPWPTRSQPETIGPHFGHKKSEICGQPETFGAPEMVWGSREYDPPPFC